MHSILCCFYAKENLASYIVISFLANDIAQNGCSSQYFLSIFSDIHYNKNSRFITRGYTLHYSSILQHILILIYREKKKQYSDFDSTYKDTRHAIPTNLSFFLLSKPSMHGIILTTNTTSPTPQNQPRRAPISPPRPSSTARRRV